MDDISKKLISTTVDHASDYDINGEDENDDDDKDELFGVETWETLTKCFNEVQSVLDRNRRLIQQVNENHRSKIPDNLARNVELIREINSNMSKVRGVYSSLSKNLIGVVHQRRAIAKDSGLVK